MTVRTYPVGPRSSEDRSQYLMGLVIALGAAGMGYALHDAYSGEKMDVAGVVERHGWSMAGGASSGLSLSQRTTTIEITEGKHKGREVTVLIGGDDLAPGTPVELTIREGGRSGGLYGDGVRRKPAGP